MNIETKTYADGTVATGPAPLPAQSPVVTHDYPACATFRGGKCTCDEGTDDKRACGVPEVPHG